MALLQEYHRPATITQALTLLSARERRLVPLAGGSRLVGLLETRALPDVDGVVDLRDLALDHIRIEGDRLRVGATATLTALTEHPVVRDLAGDLLRRAAQGEGPLNLRNVATVGGVVAAAESDSEVYAALLALDAQVVLHTATGPTAQLLATWESVPPAALITAVVIPLGASRGALARVARTPSDRPIVAALAVAVGERVRVALCGVAARPILAGTPLDPPADFKGSAVYRHAMSAVVQARVLAELNAR